MDLLAIQGSQFTTLLENESLPAGKYQWVRLMVDTDGELDSYIELSDGNSHELTIPSGNQTGLKLVHAFTLTENGTANFTIDFDVRKSVVYNGNYLLKPTLRMVDNSEIGHIKGSIDGTLFATNCTEAASIYAFSGSVEPTDISGADTDPVTTALANPDTAYSYELGFLEAGTYTLALTCEATLDDITKTDAITFISNSEVFVEKNRTTTFDF